MAKNNNKMTKDIMKNIQNSDIQMHSKLYFRILNLALIGATGLFLILSSITILIAIRDINYGNSLGIRDHGPRGTGEFLQTLPWLALATGLLTFLIAYILVKHFDFSYKRRLYTIFGALIFAVAGLGIVFATTGLERVLSTAKPFEHLKTFTRFSEENTVTGRILNIEENELVIVNVDGQEIMLVLTEDRQRRSFVYAVGDVVFAVGEWRNDIFEAYGMRPGERPLPPHVRGTTQRILK